MRITTGCTVEGDVDWRIADSNTNDPSVVIASTFPSIDTAYH